MDKGREERRSFLKAGLASTVAMALPIASAEAETPEQREGVLNLPRRLRDVLRGIYGPEVSSAPIRRSPSLKLTLPRIAENRRVVPLRISGSSDELASVVVLVKANETPIAAQFDLFEGADYDIGANIQVSASSDVYVIGRDQSGLVGTVEFVKWTVGCGAP